MGGRGYGTTGFSAGTKGFIRVRAAENWTDTAQGTNIGFFTALAGQTGTSERFTISDNGNIGIGQTTPTSYLHLKAGTATAGTAPIKLTAGTNMTTPENGAIEFDGTNIFITVGGVRKTFTIV